MSRLRSILSVTAIFVLGMIVGGLLAFGLVDRIQRRAFVEGGGGAVADLMARRLSYRLRADKTQREQFRQIYREAAGDLEVVRRKVAPDLREIFERSEKKFRAILRPEQLAEFDRITAQLRATWERDNLVDPPPAK
ncbi:MAG: hypothetical protein JSR82_18490 [Verrucomicrobia bacterium]|nr:hypothetical protein [Verrucomicrobiota bacterium]